MSHAPRPYARFYFRDFQRDYPDVYADDAAFALFMRLLALSEAVWPGVPDLPRSARPRPLALLMEKGLVAMNGHGFTLKGFHAERTQRQARARDAAAMRWQSDSNADA